MKKMVSLLAVLLFVIALGGCATLRGMGQDVENLGRGINKTVSGN